MNDTANIKRHFFDSLKRGTGEANLISRDYPKIDFSAYIIKGALRNYAYDGQSEDSRAQYVFDLISFSDKKDKIRNAILKGLATEQNDTWSLTHLFNLTKLYAQQGDQEAREAIYARFLNHPIEHSDWVGYSEILELDGLKGLLFIAEKFGKWISKKPFDWQDDWIIRNFQEENPNLNVIEELENASKSNRHIKLYLDTIQKTKKEQEKHKQDKIEYNDIIDEVLKSKQFLSFSRSNELTELKLNQIAERLLSEKNKANQEKLLEVFTNHKFPLDSEFVLKLAKQKPTKDRIYEYAIDALKFLKGDSIREFALDRIPRSKRPEPFVDILISNYQKGDYKLLTEIAKKFKSDHIIESLAGSYTNVYKANKTNECKEPLEVLYGKMNCGIHRNGIIEVLIENNVLSDKLKEEIKYDSYLETRELLDSKKNGR